MINKKAKAHPEQYQDFIGRLYPELVDETGKSIMTKTVTFQVTDDCNLACTYCYQTHKGKKVMKFEDAKKLIDMLISGDKRLGGYASISEAPGIIIEFIGGEPFLQIELIEQICDYFTDKVIEECHRWATLSRFSICSNGVLYFDEKVQKFLDKYKEKLSFSITIDGNKDLHDSCRIFPDGKPSYDLAVAGAQDWISKGYTMGSKITIAPGNLSFIYEAITHMVDLGYQEINANVVFEEGWNLNHARVYYQELKRIADYWLDNDLVESHYLSLFEIDSFVPMPEDDNKNWCGGTGSMLSMDPDGYLYPCIRYMESSLNGEQKPLYIGHVNVGIAQDECTKKCVECLNAITRKSQSTEECFYCPVARGCAWCSAYNYQKNGTVNSRCTYICDMHKSRSLANAYFWNKYYSIKNIPKKFHIYCPEEDAISIVGEKEYLYLKELEEKNNVKFEV